MRLRLAAFLLALPFLLLAADSPHRGLTISMELVKPGPFHTGEIIEANLRFEAEEHKHSWASGPAYWFRGFLLEPSVTCGTLDKPCQYMTVPGGVNGDSLNAYPPEQRTILNRYIPPLPPGAYRATLLFQLHGSEPPRLVASPAIEFEIVEAEREWLHSQISEAARVFRKYPPDMHDSREFRQPALDTLRFLQHPLAWETALKLYDGSYSGQPLLKGLFESSEPEAVCAVMRSRLDEPDQVLDYQLADCLSRVCATAEMPFPEELLGETPDKERRRTTWALEQSALRRRIREDVMSRVAKRTDILSELAVLEYGERLRSGYKDPLDVPDFVPEVAARVLKRLPNLETKRQEEVLRDRWSLLDGHPSIPVLEEILDAGQEEPTRVEVRRLALRRLLSIDEAAGRERFVDELRHFRPTLDRLTTELVPREAIPPMDKELLDYHARRQRGEVPGGPDPEMLIARYLSVGSREQLRRIHEEPTGACHPELLAYFVRAYPDYTRLLLHSAKPDMHSMPPPCLNKYVRTTPFYAWSPELEEYVAAYAWHENTEIKGACATTLRWFGSAAAREELWKAYRYFNEWWKDRPEDEFNANRAAPRLERTLRNALVQGVGWLLQPAELNAVESLCISAQCRGETMADIQLWNNPLCLTITPGHDGLPRADIVQYRNLRGMAMIENKLSQFPKDKAIQLAILGSFSAQRKKAIAARLTSVAASHGVRLITP